MCLPGALQRQGPVRGLSEREGRGNAKGTLCVVSTSKGFGGLVDQLGLRLPAPEWQTLWP